MLTRSARALPPDFNANQPVGRRLKPNAAEERRQIVHFNPTLPAAFPTLERPPPPPQRQLWARGASAALDDGPKNKRRRIDMTEDDLYNELLGDNTFLNAQPGCKEAEMPLFGEGDYKLEVKYNEDNKVELNPPSLDDLNPGEFGLPLFYDKEKIILDDPATFTFRGLSDGVKMAIMIEAFELYKDERKALDKLQLDQEDYDDYVKLYNSEAESDANTAYNVQMEEEYWTMHNMAGRFDLANCLANCYPLLHKKLTFMSALSLIKQKDVNAGQRYLNMVRASPRLINKLEDYVGSAGAGNYTFKRPSKARRSGAPANHPTSGWLAPSQLDDNHAIASLYEDAVRDGRFHHAVITSIIRDSLQVPAARYQPMAPPPLPLASAVTTTASAQPAATLATLSQNLLKHNLDNVPLLAQPPKRRRLVQGRPAEMKLPLPLQSSAADQQPNPTTPMRVPATTAALGRGDTPSTGNTFSTGDMTEFVQAMSSASRRTVSHPDDEPEYARNITSSPLRVPLAEQRRPRVAHLDRKGQNPARHSSGSGSPIVRTHMKMKRQLSGVYRPDRQWANEALSSSPLRATTPRLSPPKSGSKQYFLSEQSPAHPPSSPRLFDESGKTVRDKPPSPEEVHKIFEIQEQEARKQRQLSLGQSPILPPLTALEYQAPSSTAKMSTQPPSQLPATAETISSQPLPILAPQTATPITYQRPFANLMMSKQPAASDAASVTTSSAAGQAPVARQPPILPPPRPVSANGLAPYSSHVIVDFHSSQAGGLPTISTFAYNQSYQIIPQGTSFGGSSASGPQPQQFMTQPENQQQFLQQGQHPLGQQPTSPPPQVSAPAKAPAMKQKVHHSKTTTAPKTAGTVKAATYSSAKFGSGVKARGKPLKSTHKPPSQVTATERLLYVPPRARFDDPQATGSHQTPGPMPTTPQQAAQQARQNTLKRSHSMLPDMGNNSIMAEPHPSTELSGGLSYYNNTFSAHPKATFQSTVQDFARDLPRQNHNNQHTKNREVNPLQAPQDFSAPRGGPKSTASNASGEQPTHPNPFRGGLSSSQAPLAGAPVQGPSISSHAAQYYGHQPEQSQQPQHQNRLQQSFQPSATKQKIAHYPEPVGNPERPLWDRNNRSRSSPSQQQKVAQELVGTPERPLWDRNLHRNQLSPVQSPPMMGGVVQQTPAQTPVSSHISGDTTPKPNMPNGCMSGVMGVAGSETFAQAMKNHGVQIPGQLAKQAQALGKKKRNVGAKVQSLPPWQAQQPFLPSQSPQPQGAVMMGLYQSGMAAGGGGPVTPKKGRGRPSGTAWSGKKKAVDPKQSTMEQFLDPRLK